MEESPEVEEEDTQSEPDVERTTVKPDVEEDQEIELDAEEDQK